MEHAHTVDASLVAEALGGDRDAFGALVVRYFNPAYAVALAHLGHHESAQDAVQEAFLNAYRRLNTLRDPERFREWLITIVRNACYSLRRKERPMVPLDAVAEPAEALDLERRELHALIRSKIAELDESPREALLLYYFSGQSQAEIADLLGISHDAAQKRVSRAREVLGQRLVDEVEGALGLNAEEHTKREKQALAAVMAAPIPWDITKASAAGGAASASYTAYILVAFAVLLLVAAGLVVRQAFNAAPAPPEAAPAVAAPSEPAESADEISPAPPSAPPIIAATPRPTSRWAEGVAETAGDLSITCQVVDERDRPAADVAVRLTVFGYAGEDPVGRVLMRKVARTDDEGWFEIAGLPYHIEQDLASDYVVDAVAVNGFASLRLYYDNVFESRRLRLAPAGPIAGTVVDEAGVPIEGATVYPVKSSAIERIGTEEMAAWAVVSGPSGRFAFSALPDGVCMMVTRWSLRMACLPTPTTADLS